MRRLKNMINWAGRKLGEQSGTAAVIAAIALLVGHAHQKQFDEEVSEEVARREQHRCPGANALPRLTVASFVTR